MNIGGLKYSTITRILEAPPLHESYQNNTKYEVDNHRSQTESFKIMNPNATKNLDILSSGKFYDSSA